MRLGKIHAENFSSYETLDFDFASLGLALVYGITGSGKSVLLDAAVWVLYGQTAKGGNVDDIRSWQTNEGTKGTCVVGLGNDHIVVTRQRGKTNDLFWIESTDAGTPPRRGKDLADTQRLLEARLGVSAERFIVASYCHEFSPTGSFFTAKAKDRREVLEGLADLRFAQDVADGAKNLKTRTRSEASELARASAAIVGELKATTAARIRVMEQSVAWKQSRANCLKLLAAKVDGFEEEKAKEIKSLLAKKEAWEHERPREDEVLDDIWYVARLDALKAETRCTKCGNLPIKATEEMTRTATKRANNQELLRQQAAVNPYVAALKTAQAKTNSYAEQLCDTKEEQNPYESNITLYQEEINRLTAEGAELKNKSRDLQLRLSSLDQVQELATQHRATTLYHTVQQIEDATNCYLEKYFDGAFRVGFVLADDTLDVQITKNGYDCNYKQLSKGQRGLLRLCFVVAVMRATADTSAVKIAQVAFDEALDGLDSALKASAFRLFEELAQTYESVLVVEHAPEFQALCSTRYHIELVNDHSEITKEF